MDNFNHILTQPFYNTILLTDEQWKDRNDKAIALQKIVETVYSNNPNLKISPWQMQEYLSGRMKTKVNKNSVGRSISNLKKELKIIKLKEMRKGAEGESEHYYIWRDGNEHMETESVMPGKPVSEYVESIISTSSKLTGTLVQTNLLDVIDEIKSSK